MSNKQQDGGASPQTNQDTVISRIQKLFALAGNNPSEAEAASALAKAQELLAKHNLSMAQLDQTKIEKGITEAEGARTKTKVERSAMFTYQRKLWEALAGANFCVYWSHKVFHASGIYSTHHHFMIGREENVETVKVMGDYLEKAVNRLCPYKKGADVNLWKTGAVSRIGERLAEQARESRIEAPTTPTESTAVVVMADVYDRETHGNHVFQYGVDSGWCPCRKCSVKRRAEWEKRQAEMPVVVKAEPEPVKAETEVQKRKREAAEARANQKWNDRWYRQQDEEQRVRGSEAYQAGRQTGGEIGLNKQVKEN